MHKIKMISKVVKEKWNDGKLIAILSCFGYFIKALLAIGVLLGGTFQKASHNFKNGKI